MTLFLLVLSFACFEAIKGFQEEPDGFLGGMTETGSGRPVPDPPQAEHSILPEPPHVLHPTSASDQRRHMHPTLPVPLHLGQRGHPPAIGLSIMDLAIKAPANSPKPVANCEITAGAMPPPYLTATRRLLR